MNKIHIQISLKSCEILIHTSNQFETCVVLKFQLCSINREMHINNNKFNNSKLVCYKFSFFLVNRTGSKLYLYSIMKIFIVMSDSFTYMRHLYLQNLICIPSITRCICSTKINKDDLIQFPTTCTNLYATSSCAIWTIQRYLSANIHHNVTVKRNNHNQCPNFGLLVITLFLTFCYAKHYNVLTKDSLFSQQCTRKRRSLVVLYEYMLNLK